MSSIVMGGWVEELLITLEGSGNFNSPRVRKFKAGASVFIEGTVSIENQTVSLVVALPPAFPAVLPTVYLQPNDALGFIPHVMASGMICFVEPEGLLLDRNAPTHIVLESLEKAIQVLTDGISGRNQTDFVDEFEAYWSRIPEVVPVVSLINPSDEILQLKVARNRRENTIYLAISEQEINSFYNRPNRRDQVTIENGLYIPLEKSSLIVPPDPDGAFWTTDIIRHNIVSNISQENRNNLTKLLKGQGRRVKYILVKLPRFAGRENLFGIKFEQFGDKHPLLGAGQAKKVTPLSIERYDPAFLVTRGGGNNVIRDKRILLVGCGSVGGSIAIELIKAGVSSIMLVDPDEVNPENTYRHVLGRNHWSLLKVVGLKKEIEAKFPYVNVEAVGFSIEYLLTNGKINLRDFDLIILATGNPTLELSINEQIHQYRLGPMALYTWVEPFSIGGHSILTNNASTGGCLECLYTSPAKDNYSELENRASFAASGQTFGRAISGCGSLHTPYGSLDAVQTALVATRLAISALNGNEIGNPLVSWKGDSSKFSEEGFQLSHRYNIPETKLYDDRYRYKINYCRVCGSRN